MENIVFINPSYMGATSDFSCGLLLMGSYLESKGYNVKLFFSTENLSELDDYINEDTLFVGFSVMTVQIKAALNVIKHIKKRYPHMKIVVGGYHSILYPEQIAENDLIDVAVVGDGEDTCLELAEVYSGKGKLEDVKGIAYKKDGKVVFTEKRNFTDVSKLPTLNYNLIHNFKLIERISESGDPVKAAVIFFAKGCPLACTFCINSAIKKDWQGRDLKMIFDEIEYLIKGRGASYIYMVDEFFFIRKQRFFDFLDEIERRNLKFEWSPQCRVNCVSDNYLSSDVLKRMRKLGCKSILFGVESGSQKMLNQMKKGIYVKQIIHAIKELKKADIIPKLNFIIGMPDEEREDMLKTFKLIHEIYKIAPDFYLMGPGIFRPYPGGVMYNELVENNGYTPPNNLLDWDFTDSGWNDRYLLDKSPWITERDLILDIKDTLYVYIKFKNEKKFQMVRFFLKRVYKYPKLMNSLLKTIPYLDPSAKTLFRPDLETVYQELLDQTEGLEL